MLEDRPANDDRGAAAGGMALLLAGSVGLLLLLAARSGGLPLRWTSAILPHAPAWGLGSVLLAGLGVRLLWQQQHPGIGWSPERPGRRFRTLVVYSRRECCLCDEALELLARYGRWLPAAIEVDIDDDPELQRRFNACVPVVECDGKIRFKGRVSEPLLRRLIEGTAPEGMHHESR